MKRMRFHVIAQWLAMQKATGDRSTESLITGPFADFESVYVKGGLRIETLKNCKTGIELKEK